MIISKIIEGDSLYYHLHAEQTITSAFAEIGDLGILEKEVTKQTFDKIIVDYKKTEPNNPKYLVLNFERIEAIQNNLLPVFSALRKLNSNLVLINIKSHIIQELGLDSLFTNKNNQKDERGNYNVFYVSEALKAEINFLTKDIFRVLDG